MSYSSYSAKTAKHVGIKYNMWRFMLASGIRFQPSNIGGLSIINKHRGQHQTRDIMNIIGDIMGCETNSIK